MKEKDPRLVTWSFGVVLYTFHLLLLQKTATLLMRSKDSYSPAVEGIFKKNDGIDNTYDDLK
jgi:hypothetical protein